MRREGKRERAGGPLGIGLLPFSQENQAPDNHEGRARGFLDERLGEDERSSQVFVFGNRRRNRVKML